MTSSHQRRRAKRHKMEKAGVRIKMDWTLFCRSYLITLGLVFVLFDIWFGVVTNARGELFALGPLVLLLVFAGGGIALVWFGIRGPRRTIERFANSASKHWAAALLMIPAYPVYKILAAAQKQRKSDAQQQVQGPTSPPSAEPRP